MNIFSRWRARRWKQANIPCLKSPNGRHHWLVPSRGGEWDLQARSCTWGCGTTLRTMAEIEEAWKRGQS